MEEENLSALYNILKEQNVFSSREAMDAFIKKEGVAPLYSFMPEGYFTDEAAFIATFQTSKKKEESSQPSEMPSEGIRVAETEERKGFRSASLLERLSRQQKLSQEFSDPEQLYGEDFIKTLSPELQEVFKDPIEEEGIDGVPIQKDLEENPMMKLLAAERDKPMRMDEKYLKSKEDQYNKFAKRNEDFKKRGFSRKDFSAAYFQSDLYDEANSLNIDYINAGGVGNLIEVDEENKFGLINKDALDYLKLSSENFTKLMEEEKAEAEAISNAAQDIGLGLPYAVANRLYSGTENLGAGVWGWFNAEGAQNFMLRKGYEDEGFKKSIGLTQEEIQKGVSENIQDGNIEAALINFGLGLTETVPQIALIAGTTYAGVPQLGMAVLGASAGGSTYSDLMMNPSVSKAEAIAGGGLVAIGEFAAEAVPIFRIDVNQLQRAFVLNGNKSVRQIFRDRNIFNNLATEGMSVVKSGREEALEELIATSVEQTVNAALTGEGFNAYELADASFLGFGMGGGIRMITTLPSFHGSMKTTKELQRLKNSINKIEEELSNPDLKQSTRRSLNKDLKKLRLDAAKLLSDDTEFYSKMSKKDLAEILKINQEIGQAALDYRRADNDTQAQAARRIMKENQIAKERIESKYREVDQAKLDKTKEALDKDAEDNAPVQEAEKVEIPKPERNKDLSVEEDTDYQGKVREGLDKSEGGRKLMKAVKRVESAAKKIFKMKGFGVQLLDSSEYSKKKKELGVKTERGFLDSESGTIYINVKNFDEQHLNSISSVPFHELAHVVLQRAFGGNEKLFIDSFKKMKSVIAATKKGYSNINTQRAIEIRTSELIASGLTRRQALARIRKNLEREITLSDKIEIRDGKLFAESSSILEMEIDKFTKLYEEKKKKGEELTAVQAEEGIVAVMEAITDNQIELLENKGFRDSFRSFINNLLRSLGIELNYTDKDIVDIINTFAKDVKVGKDVSKIKRRGKKKSDKKEAKKDAKESRGEFELFTFGSNVFNIDKGLEIAEELEEISIKAKDVGQLRMPFVFKDEKTINKADISKPVLLGTMRFGDNTNLLLIDGHHRVEKAFRDNKPIKAKTLSEEQTSSIRESKGKMNIEDAKSNVRNVGISEEMYYGDFSTEENFNRFKGDNRLIKRNEDIQKVKTGEPVIMNLAHGTTHEFYKFDASVRGNPEGHFGKVNYFTSSKLDAKMNYLSGGADLKGRIERRAEVIYDSLNDEYNFEEKGEFKRAREDYNLVEPSFKSIEKTIKKEDIDTYDVLANAIALKELKGQRETVLDLWVKLNNPVVLHGMSRIEMQRKMKPFNGTGKSYEEVFDALNQAIQDNLYDPDAVDAGLILSGLYPSDNVDANELYLDLRDSDLIDASSMTDDGEFAGAQIVAETFRNLGFDGIILANPMRVFAGMMIGMKTSHVHVFDEFNNQIKLADGRNVTFDERKSDIRESRGKMEIKDAKLDKEEIRNQVRFYESKGVIMFGDEQFNKKVKAFEKSLGDIEMIEIVTQALDVMGLNSKDIEEKVKQELVFQENMLVGFSQEIAEKYSDLNETLTNVLGEGGVPALSDAESIRKYIYEYGADQLAEDLQELTVYAEAAFKIFRKITNEIKTGTRVERDFDYSEYTLLDVLEKGSKGEEGYERISQYLTDKSSPDHDLTGLAEIISHILTEYSDAVEKQFSQVTFSQPNGLGDRIIDKLNNGFARRLGFETDFHPTMTVMNLINADLEDLIENNKYGQDSLDDFLEVHKNNLLIRLLGMKIDVLKNVEIIGDEDYSEELDTSISLISQEQVEEWAFTIFEMARKAFAITPFLNSAINKESMALELIRKAVDSIYNEKSGLITVFKDNIGLEKQMNRELETLDNNGAPLKEVRQLKELIEGAAGLERYGMRIQKTQRETIKKFVDWFDSISRGDVASLDVSEGFHPNLPVTASTAFAYMIVKAVSSTNYNLSNGRYIKRTNKSLKNIMPFNEDALRLLYSEVLRSLTEGERINMLQAYSEIQRNISTEVVNSNSILEYETTDEIPGGYWLKFNKGTTEESLEQESTKLAALVQDTPWCTKYDAKSQVESGDFYVYVTLDEDNIPNPRIAIRLYHGSDASSGMEIRGILTSQEMEPVVIPVLKKFLNESNDVFSGEDLIEYNGKADFNERARSLYRKLKEQGEWLEEDNDEFLELMESPYKEGFGQSSGLNGFYERLLLMVNELPGNSIVTLEQFMPAVLSRDDDMAWDANSLRKEDIIPSAFELIKISEAYDYLASLGFDFDDLSSYKDSKIFHYLNSLDNPSERGGDYFKNTENLPDEWEIKRNVRKILVNYNPSFIEVHQIAPVFQMIHSLKNTDFKNKKSISFGNSLITSDFIVLFKKIGVYDKLLEMESIDKFTVDVSISGKDNDDASAYGENRKELFRRHEGFDIDEANEQADDLFEEIHSLRFNDAGQIDFLINNPNFKGKINTISIHTWEKSRGTHWSLGFDEFKWDDDWKGLRDTHTQHSPLKNLRVMGDLYADFNTLIVHPFPSSGVSVGLDKMYHLDITSLKRAKGNVEIVVRGEGNSIEIGDVGDVKSIHLNHINGKRDHISDGFNTRTVLGNLRNVESIEGIKLDTFTEKTIPSPFLKSIGFHGQTIDNTPNFELANKLELFDNVEEMRIKNLSTLNNLGYIPLYFEERGGNFSKEKLKAVPTKMPSLKRITRPGSRLYATRKNSSLLIPIDLFNSIFPKLEIIDGFNLVINEHSLYKSPSKLLDVRKYGDIESVRNDIINNVSFSLNSLREVRNGELELKLKNYAEGIAWRHYKEEERDDFYYKWEDSANSVRSIGKKFKLEFPSLEVVEGDINIIPTTIGHNSNYGINMPNLKNYSSIKMDSGTKDYVADGGKFSITGSDAFTKGFDDALKEHKENNDIRESRGKLNLSGLQQKKLKTPLIDSSIKRSKSEVGLDIPLSRRIVSRLASVFSKRNWTDRQSVVRKALYKANAKLANSALTNRSGSRANASKLFLSMSRKIFSGLNSKETKLLNELIILRRIIDIDGRSDSNGKDRIKHTKVNGVSYNKEVAEAKIEEMKEVMSDESWFELENRADTYFQSWRSIIERKVSEGLISVEDGNRLKQADYSPRVFLDVMFGAKGDMASIARSTNLSKNEIKALKSGYEGDLFPDAEALLQMGVQSMEARIAANRVFIEIAKLAGQVDWVKPAKLKKKYKDKEKKSFTLIPDVTKVESGYKLLYYKEGGVTKAVQVKDSHYDMIQDPDKGLMRINEIESGILRFVAKVAAAPGRVVRGAATQLNPLFFIKNIPMDFQHVIFWTDVYDDVGLGAAMVQLSKDFGEIWKALSVGKVSERFNVRKFDEIMSLLDEAVGFGMTTDYLTQQERKLTNQNVLGASYKSRAKKLVKGVFDKGAFLSNTSEVAMRLAVYRRIKEQELAKGSSFYEAGMYAAQRAKETIAFDQGGEFIKNVDQFIPYLNAIWQGTRVAGNYVVNQSKTKEGRIKLAKKFGSAYTGIIMMRLAFNFLMDALGYDDEEDKDLISEWDQINYINIPVAPKSELGEMVYGRIRVHPNNTPLLAAGNATGDWLYEEIKQLSGTESPDDERAKQIRLERWQYNITKSLVDQIDPLIPITRDPKSGAIKADLNFVPPSIEAPFTYGLNYDFFRDRKISYDKDLVSPELEYDERVNDIYKVVGKSLEMSPRRLQVSTETIITNPSVNVIVAGAYTIADQWASSYLEDFEKSPSTEKNFLRQAGSVIFKVGKPRYKAYKTDIIEERKQERADERAVSKKMIDKAIFNATELDKNIDIDVVIPKVSKVFKRINEDFGESEALYSINYFSKKITEFAFLSQDGNTSFAIRTNDILKRSGADAAAFVYENGVTTRKDMKDLQEQLNSLRMTEKYTAKKVKDFLIKEKYPTQELEAFEYKEYEFSKSFIDEYNKIVKQYSK